VSDWEMVQQDLNFKHRFEDFVAVDDVVPCDLMSNNNLCDNRPEVEDISEVHEESASVPRYF
jgi:hypothetical protein